MPGGGGGDDASVQEVAPSRWSRDELGVATERVGTDTL